MQWFTCLVALLVFAVPCWSQAPAPPVDRTNPTAVVEAYVHACEKGDAKAAVALLSDAEVGSALQHFAEAVTPPGAEEADPMSPVSERAFIPRKRRAIPLTTQTKVEGGETIVTAAQQMPPQVQTFVLVNGPQGWSVDLIASLKRTAPKGHWADMLEHSVTRLPTRYIGGDPKVRKGLTVLLHQFMSFLHTREMMVPSAANWTDEFSKYLLDAATLRRPGLPRGQYGYALNNKIAGKRLHDPWADGAEPAERNVAVLFETADLSPNAAADIDEVLAARKPADPLILVGIAEGDVLAIPPGKTVAEITAPEPKSEDDVACRQLEDCKSHVRELCDALLDYAHAHDGKVPAADSWCDDVGLQMKPEDVTPDLFKCPAVPKLRCGYAINSDLAGVNIRTLEHHENYVLLLPSVRGVRNEARKVPEKLEGARHTHRDNDAKPCDVFGLLNAETLTVDEGEAIADAIAKPRGD